MWVFALNARDYTDDSRLLEDAASQVSHDLMALGSAIATAFPVLRRTDARVVWLNHRWFLEQGVDVSLRETEAVVHRELLRDFAWTAPRLDTTEPDGFYAPDGVSEFRADRYGASSAASHGGSGRCGIVGSLNAKGIGPTPLRSTTADWYHSHGCMWLEEAIREAILGEVAATEFPHGAVPAVAIIALDGRVRDRLGSRLEDRRALLIRPNFIRPAHFERASGFGSAGTRDSDAFHDATRTRDAVHRYREHMAGAPISGIRSRSLDETFVRLSEQVGFGWAHRLFHGAYVSSNLTIDGSLCDFGSFRSLPSWRGAYTVEGAFPFGKDVHAFGPSLRSIRYYFRRFGGVSVLPSMSVGVDVLEKIATRAFHDELARFFEVDVPLTADIRAAIVSSLDNYFRRQQNDVVDYFRGEQRLRTSWIYLSMSDRGDGDQLEDGVIRELRSYLAESDESTPGEGSRAFARWQKARRYLRPRRLLYRENLLRLVQSFASGSRLDDPDGSQVLQELIRKIVARSRRHWPGLPTDVIAMSHAYDGSAVAVRGICTRTGQWVTWVDGPVVAEHWIVFGQRIPVGVLNQASELTRFESGRLCMRLPADGASRHAASAHPIVPDITLSIPKSDIVFCTGDNLATEL